MSNSVDNNLQDFYFIFMTTSPKTTQFQTSINDGYTFDCQSITIGGAVLDAQVVPNTLVKLPLTTMNRHGLIAGATGTGKTKTVQKIIESLSEAGVPSLVLDIKGDVSGISKAGDTSNQKVIDRSKLLGIEWLAKKYPVEFLTISATNGVKLRATVTEFGPNLFSKMLDLNETQESAIAMIFKYCDDQALALLDLADLKAVLQYLLSDNGKDQITLEYGNVSPATTSTILRKVVELESTGGNLFFGEKSFEVNDLLRSTSQGLGYVNIMRVCDIQGNPKLFATFMLAILAEIYTTFPEVGDIDKPKLCLFIDEAHLIFDQATPTLLNQIEMTIKLIRSKGVGIYFITQNPMDVPESVLAQLGLKIQHSLRAFTANDRKAIKMASENYPLSDYYKIDELITNLGIGEALVTALNLRGNPTPLVHTMIIPPSSLMGTITEQELSEQVNQSQLAAKYNQVTDRESALEILKARMQQAVSNPVNNTQVEPTEPTLTKNPSKAKEEPSMIESLASNSIFKSVGRLVATELTRTVLGALGLRGKRR